MTWYYNGEEFTDPGEYYGYIYCIKDLITGKKYIGRKFFTLAGYKTVKGKRKRIRKPSDWQEYWGSSKELLTDIETHGKSRFKRIILRLCKTRSECSYFEAKEIFSRDAIISEDYYNAWVSARIQGKHLKSLLT